MLNFEEEREIQEAVNNVKNPERKYFHSFLKNIYHETDYLSAVKRYENKRQQAVQEEIEEEPQNPTVWEKAAKGNPDMAKILKGLGHPAFDNIKPRAIQENTQQTEMDNVENESSVHNNIDGIISEESGIYETVPYNTIDNSPGVDSLEPENLDYLVETELEQVDSEFQIEPLEDTGPIEPFEFFHPCEGEEF